MTDVLFMAWRYLVHNRIKSAILILSITLIIYLPIGLKVVVEESSASLTARADATPLIIGAKGSPLELVLNTLYFESDMPETMPYREAQRAGDYRLATLTPLYTRFHTGKQPIVGTTLDYLDQRGLQVAAGRNMAMLGECVVGASAARKLKVGVGGAVISSPESVFDIAGVYPLKMHVVGVLAPAGTPDDDAVFVDLNTTWIIEGLAHGHQDLTTPEAAAAVLKREGNTIVANASVVQYNEITPANADSFHFHGDTADFPISAIIAFPHTPKTATLLRGKYLGDEERVQIVASATVMQQLLDTILTVQRYVVAAVVVVGFSTFSTAILVFLLSLRLRRREIITLHKIGGAKARVVSILVSEIVMVVTAGVVLAAALTVLTAHYGSAIMQAMLLG